VAAVAAEAPDAWRDARTLPRASNRGIPDGRPGLIDDIFADVPPAPLRLDARRAGGSTPAPGDGEGRPPRAA